MLTIEEAFAKFKHRQELTTREQDDVSRRHKEVRDVVADTVRVERDFLSGSYARWTKTRPLKDVDVFCVLHEDERSFRTQHPSAILGKIEEGLVSVYGQDHVRVDRMAVTVDFGVAVSEDDETDDKVMSIDVVPGFPRDGHFEIPDADFGTWIETSPEAHARLAVQAHDAYSREWKPLVRMIKKWNRHNGRPITPSFLLEVMALDLLVPPFSGGYPYELKGFFASAADRIHDAWPDPGGLGPAVSDAMALAQKDAAKRALTSAEANVSQAILLARQGKTGEALRSWRALFGPQFPLS
ncbi:MAG: nucleotidyltransferase [Thermoflexaceae bacterium]|nr:nucleotidyltransferase [Thermoflexaceae bacterium]